ncbi:MAG: hypothetical protein ABEI97_00615 [Candidatus Nanohaloarchaea archaeon]
MNELLIGIITALQLGVFAVMLAYVYLVERTAEMPGLQFYYPVGLAFVVLGEFVFVVTQIPPGGAGLAADSGVLEITAATYLVAGIFAAGFARQLHRHTRDG